MTESYLHAGRLDVKARLTIPGVEIEVREDYFHKVVSSVIRGDQVRLTLIHSKTSWDGCLNAGRGTPRYTSVGNTFLEPPNVPFHTHGTIGHFRVIRCSFSPSLFRRTTGIFDWTDMELSSCLNIKEPNVVFGLNRLARESLEPGFASNILVESVATAIMVDISRYLQKGRDPDKGRSTRMTAWQLRRTMDYIQERCEQPMTVSELAQLCGFSPRHFQRIFSATTGQSVHTCIEQVRMQKARSLLSEGNLSIQQIAAQVGFASTASFSVAFHRVTGETPSAFRRQASASPTWTGSRQ